ncbi:hypothetical protein A2Y85_04140 [candidate division WOR-3 bacterium RBG_13_43_14]|uniref:Helix-hairpin-helix DNA-binding motif class 1 domain-containing protein n=1 Tax=candidate division WOR-3 bacterium RBG_13_43_14 TaxID=1802590 RepID=A0A1F4UCC3_UNCW3|nr:MAG: hypothetical protein A2Y85_04140 [candidate division WOR-3 bacterium RBG_13_43_14]
MMLIFMIMLIDDAVIFEIEGKNDLEIIAREIEMLRIAPIDVNKAEFSELIRIPYLSVNDCMRIIEYRRQHGAYNNINELINVPGMDRILFERIKPYVTTMTKKIVVEKYHSRVRWQRFFPDHEYADDCYSKHELFSRPYRVYFINEKDRYERSLFDYYAVGLMTDEGKRHLVIGRYNLDLGKGLVLSQAGSFLYGSDLRLQIEERGIIPYTSVIENGGFFGAALSDSLLAHLTLFYSNQKIDARIDSNGYAYSFFEGDHVDTQSRSYKDRLNEELIGYDVKYSYDRYLFANRTYWCKYEPAFVSSDSLRGFYGDHFWISSVEFNYHGQSFLMFGEVARAHQDRIGGIFGFSNGFSVCDFTAAVQYFPIGFISPKGVESKNGYLGGAFEISSRNKFCNFNADLKYEKNAESDSMLYRFALAFERKVSFLVGRLQMNWRYASNFDRAGSAILIRAKPFRSVFFDLRLEDKYIFAQDSVYRGLIGCLEIGLDKKFLKLRLRYGIFDTENYQARLNVYEIDLPGVINNRMLYGLGDYSFVYLSGNLTSLLTISSKYSIIRRDNNLTHKIGAQVDMRIKNRDQ